MTGRRAIPLHYQDGPGTACRKTITPSARICHTQDPAQVTCRACLRALDPEDYVVTTRKDEITQDLIAGMARVTISRAGEIARLITPGRARIIRVSDLTEIPVSPDRT